jgi:hypothetical protein
MRRRRRRRVTMLDDDDDHDEDEADTDADGRKGMGEFDGISTDSLAGATALTGSGFLPRSVGAAFGAGPLAAAAHAKGEQS